MKFHSTNAGPILLKKNIKKNRSCICNFGSLLGSKTVRRRWMCAGDKLIFQPQLRSEPYPALIAVQFVKTGENVCVTSDRCVKRSRHFPCCRNSQKQAKMLMKQNHGGTLSR